MTSTVLEMTGVARDVTASWHSGVSSRGAVVDRAAVGAADVRIALRAAVDALAAVPRALDPYRAIDDAALLALTRLAADEVRLAQLHVSLLAGEIARRSAPELGHSGLAQSRGHRTPDELVRVTTGTRLTDARAAVRVGSAVAETGPLTDAVLDGRVSVAVADAISTGLGVAAAGVDDSTLATAAEQLIDRVAGLDADRAAREARAVRDELDAEGIQQREEVMRDRRSLRIGRRADGMGYANWVLDPETFAIVSEVYDRITSPRRGGPSFVAADESAEGERADGALDDLRTTEQLASDTFAELLRHGASADTSQLLGDDPIGVRMLVAARTLTRRHGAAWFEGQPDAVSVATAERLACAAGTITVTVDDDGQPLNLGRERRLFSRSQRIALAARDGGCRWPGCERPPSWCEAHHIDHWLRDGGRTDVADGILLCRHHHLLVHNNGWQISRAGPQYLLAAPAPGASPPPGLGRAGEPPGEPRGEPIDMPSRSRALADALRSA